jgi:hypothetical protein
VCGELRRLTTKLRQITKPLGEIPGAFLFDTLLYQNVITEYNDLMQGLNQSTANKPFNALAFILQRSTKNDLKRAPGHRTADPGRSRQVGGGWTLPFLSVQAIRNLYLLVEMSRATPL